MSRTKRPAIPLAARRHVAARAGGLPGEKTPARCAYCRKPGSMWWPNLYRGNPGAWVHFRDLHLDHIIPLHLGGDNTADNLALACENCNCSKGFKRLEDWWKP